MKVLIQTPNSEGVARVDALYPDEFVPEEVSDKVFDALTFEEPINLFGKAAIIMYDVNTKSVFHEYEDRPLTQDEIIQVQSQKIDQLENLLADITEVVLMGV